MTGEVLKRESSGSDVGILTRFFTRGQWIRIALMEVLCAVELLIILFFQLFPVIFENFADMYISPLWTNLAAFAFLLLVNLVVLAIGWFYNRTDDASARRKIAERILKKERKKREKQEEEGASV